MTAVVTTAVAPAVISGAGSGSGASTPAIVMVGCGVSGADMVGGKSLVSSCVPDLQLAVVVVVLVDHETPVL